MTASKPNLLIVEDEEAILQGLSDVFTFNGYAVDSAVDGEDGLKKALQGKYHLIILDVMLPKMDGFTVCNKIRETDRSQPIIMLTAKNSEEDIIQGLKLGADDYISKPFSVRELLARVASVLRRSTKLALESDKVELGNLTIDPVRLSGEMNGESISFTRREIDILLHLFQHNDRPVSRQELLKEVWGYTNVDHIETRTVDIHITKLRRKIESDSSKPTLLVTVRGEGYQLKASP
jgi:two-component system response regulator RegX3